MASPSKRARIDNGTSIASSSTSTVKSPTKPRAQIIMVSDIRTPKKPKASAASTPRRPRASPTKHTSPTKVKAAVLLSPAKATPKKQETIKTPKKRRVVDTSDAGSGEGSSSESSDEEDNEEEEEGEEEGDTASRLLKKTATDDDGNTGLESSIRRTTADNFFHLTSRTFKTSDNVFSALLPQLSPEDVRSLLASSPVQSKHAELVGRLHQTNTNLFPQFVTHLATGFNVLCYGYGSKRSLLNTFARDMCSKRGHVAVINGFFPTLNIRDSLQAIIESIPGLNDSPSAPTAAGLSIVEGQARRIYHFFRQCSKEGISRRPLFLIVHNIDSLSLRTARAKSALALLASNPHIHMIASADHINAGLMWSTGEMAGRKHEYPLEDVEEEDKEDIPSSRGFAWIWHHTPTFLPYEIELSFRDLSVLPTTKMSSVVQSESSSLAGHPVIVNESAAVQVLASVTAKAKKLLLLLGNYQLSATDSLGGGGGEGGGEMEGMPFELLVRRAREEFLASSDTALKTLLTEFKDHGLVVRKEGGTTSTGDGGDLLWIPLGRAVLTRVIEGLKV